MRLTCPNCDAQYEVPDEVVPVAGRDVQCSNCGQTWFQHHPDHAPADEDETDLGLGNSAPDEDEEVAPPPPPPPPAVEEPPRRQLDPAVADILRQEAEAEHAARQARQAQAQALETQPDLGLDTADDPAPHGYDDDSAKEDAPAAAQDQRALEAKRRMARMRGEAEPVSEAAANAAALSSRRELLPDIDEINSTLRSDSDRSAGSRDAHGSHAPQEVKKRKRRVPPRVCTDDPDRVRDGAGLYLCAADRAAIATSRSLSVILCDLGGWVAGDAGCAVATLADMARHNGEPVGLLITTPILR